MPNAAQRTVQHVLADALAAFETRPEQVLDRVDGSGLDELLVDEQREWATFVDAALDERADDGDGSSRRTLEAHAEWKRSAALVAAAIRLRGGDG